MRVHLYRFAAMLPLALMLVSLAMSLTGSADPCPTPDAGGC